MTAVPGVECLETLLRRMPEAPSCDTERELSTCITGASVVDASCQSVRSRDRARDSVTRECAPHPLALTIIRRPDDAVEANDTHNAYNAAPNAGE